MMKKLILAAVLFFAGATTALAEEWNFGGQWKWANTARFAGNNAKYANTHFYLTLFPATMVGNRINGRYCIGESKCYNVVAFERPGGSMDFTLNGNFFEFFLNKQTQTLEGSFWEAGKSNRVPDATIVMSPLG